MCGIIAYAGPRSAVNLLIDGLHRLEYRGYDSAGLAVQGSRGELQVEKRVGRVIELQRAIGPEIKATTGIAHTR
jgi:glucosamine--fructose-6-phosphate aminotransferase (isomerizing)